MNNQHKHTPGPWTVEPPSDSESDYDKREKDYWSIRAPGPNDCISHEVARLSGWNIDRDEHTARLIAAAPELLQGCETALSYIEAVCFNTPNPKKQKNYADCAAILRAAIAKATGATHE